MPVSARAQAAMNLAETDEIWLPLLVIECDDLDAPLRIVSNTEDIVSNGETYTAYPFEMDLPPQDDEVTISTRIQIDNVDLDIMKTLRAVTGRPKLTLSIVLARTPDILERGPMEFDLETIDYDAATIEGSLVFDSILEEPSGAYSFTPQYFPALFGQQ
jgi:hypothetical protein